MTAIVDPAGVKESFETEDAIEPVPPSDIVAYNELRSCADLLRLHTSGKLEIQPDFQREVVWKQDDQTRFIDSLVKQLPIPSMCFSLDHRTQKWKVIDGLQRMSSIIRFLSPTPWKLSALPDIRAELQGRTNLEIKNGDEVSARLYSLVEDVSIPITVIRCDYSQQSHMRYLFTIFHRLNSGGVRLTNQEIRNCIFSGEFNDMLKRFDQTRNWSLITKRIWGSMDRFRSVEVALRVLAFGDSLESYDGNLARFLNDYMQVRSTNDALEIERSEKKLMETASIAAPLVGVGRPKLPLSLVEAALVGIYQNVETVKSRSHEDVKAAFEEMRMLPTFQESARYAVSSAENVTIRLKLAIEAFA
jgi:hypothetical protein